MDLVRILSQSGRDVGLAREAEEVDRGVAEGGQVLRGGAVTDSAVVFAISGVADPVQTILDVPMASPPVQELTRIGVVARDARDGVLSLDRLFTTAYGAPGETTDLSHAGPIEMLG